MRAERREGREEVVELVRSPFAARRRDLSEENLQPWVLRRMSTC